MIQVAIPVYLESFIVMRFLTQLTTLQAKKNDQSLAGLARWGCYFFFLCVQ